MVSLIIGHKGTGKTKHLIEEVNAAAVPKTIHERFPLIYTENTGFQVYPTKKSDQILSQIRLNVIILLDGHYPLPPATPIAIFSF